MALAHNELTALLRAQIEATGPISFAHFMDVALYHPVHGYYRQASKQIGCQGDFYTSVSVGPLLGQLLAFQFARWLETEPVRGRLPGSVAQTSGTERARFQWVEAGAHDGRLALDILSWVQQLRPELLDKVEYWIIEPSPTRRQVQEQTLKAFSSHVRWLENVSNLPSTGVRGVIFANELLDAFPVWRIGWDASRREWFEWRVAWENDQFVWRHASTTGSPTLTAELANLDWQWPPAELGAVLPQNYTVEICPAARAWWQQAAVRLGQGKLLTFDYGLVADELYVPHRPEGTLRSYQSHRLTSNPLAHPGEQDLTAHVNFSVIRQAGEQAGLQTDCFCSQGAFLTGVLADALADPARFGDLTPAMSRQFHTLTHPEHLGRAFRVLVQSR